MRALDSGADLFLENLDVPLDPAPDNACVGDPAPQGFYLCVQIPSLVLQPLGPDAERLIACVRVREVLPRSRFL